MSFYLRLLLILLFPSLLLSQTKDIWFPSDINIRPFAANFLEARNGVDYSLGKNELRLDIGGSQDLYHHLYENKVISFGGDFFTFTRLRGEKNFHFPVDAIDYLFGINAGYKVYEGNREYGIRARFSHISAHFVDGHFDSGTEKWRDGRRPTVYSREFIELFPFYRVKNFRLYAGFTYLVHTDPVNLGKDIYQAGFDFYLPSIIDNFVHPFIAYDFKLQKINEYRGNHIGVVGIKFGSILGRGLKVQFSYYSGYSIHGEYYDVRENYSAIGFNFGI